jgi:phosphotransferase system enzyme I (PtsP)
MPDDVILIARNMGPAELLDYDRRSLRGLALEEGSPTAHVAIVARALDIPVVGRMPGLLSRIEPGDSIVLDGDNSQLFIRPGEDIVQAFADSMRARAERRATFAATRDLPAITSDGVTVSLQMNAGLLIDMQHLEASGAAGVGLYRTEIPFMVRDEFPDVVRQTELYRKVLDHAGGRPVAFRTLDIGGDKVLPYWDASGEENPAMGWRAIRIALDRPSMLRQQLRALLLAAAGRPLSVMFPMVAEVAEFDAARRILDLELSRLAAHGGQPPVSLKVGVMFEVPALAWQLPALLARVDFVSVGSNDLQQFLFASDRGNARLAGRYDALSPTMLGVLRGLIEAGDARGVPFSLCGEMAGRPLDAMALIGLGFRTLSMPSPAIGPVKTMVRSLEVARLRHFLASLLDRPVPSLREHLRAFARDHDVVI